MLDQVRMVPPPAPQPPGLRRLRIASGGLLLASALSVVLIRPIADFSIYAVAGVVAVMLAAILSAVTYWVRRERLERTYWTDERTAAHMTGVAEALYAKAHTDRPVS